MSFVKEYTTWRDCANWTEQEKEGWLVAAINTLESKLVLGQESRNALYNVVCQLEGKLEELTDAKEVKVDQVPHDGKVDARIADDLGDQVAYLEDEVVGMEKAIDFGIEENRLLRAHIQEQDDKIMRAIAFLKS